MWIEFLNSKVGQDTRLKYKSLYTPGIHPMWTCIFPITKEIQIGINTNKKFHRTQFPIQQASARTIHRSQGLSLHSLAFSPDKCNKHGLTYTALSRVRTLENLHLLNPLNETHFTLDKNIQKETLRLSNNAKWDITFTNNNILHPNNILITTLNTRSLTTHSLDIEMHSSLCLSTVLCLQEVNTQELEFSHF